MRIKNYYRSACEQGINSFRSSEFWFIINYDIQSESYNIPF